VSRELVVVMLGWGMGLTCVQEIVEERDEVRRGIGEEKRSEGRVTKSGIGKKG
jgi:hypothetical protein